MEPSPLAGNTSKPTRLAPNSIAIGAIEGWRGMIFHLVMTDESGKIGRYKVVDPSFFNWQALAIAMRGEGISDFPLCNKSFNLSYCGFDL
jgi:Ni,Fe-hydrogenase III large subunit